MTNDEELKLLDRIVGEWTTEATHPMMPGLVVHGSATGEWLEGRRFLILRAQTDHPDFPDSISMIGYMDQDRSADDGGETGRQQLRMHYFDSRGVFRIYDSGVDQSAWRWWRNVPKFSQRFTGTFESGNDVIVGQGELCRDDVHWEKDLAITYRRKV